MTEQEKRQAAKDFAEYWQAKGDEKQETQKFWIDLMQNVLGVSDALTHISFELPVKIDHTSYIDAYIESTRVLIEQKSKDIDLTKPALQSDGTLLTPFQQARRYAGYLPFNQTPRWIIVSNFRTFHIHDMNKPNAEPEVINLSDLPKEYHCLDFVVKECDELLHHEEEVSIKAGILVGKLYDALLKQYKDPTSEETLRSLNKLCVRLVFCLYAEDALLFGNRLAFHNYISRFEPRDIRRALIDLFEVFDTKPEDRDPYLDESLAAFPYVSGGLFASGLTVAEDGNPPNASSSIPNSSQNQNPNGGLPSSAAAIVNSQLSILNSSVGVANRLEIPNFTEEIKQMLLRNASEDFDWSSISPTIFGAVFESTLNPETRRKGGMHYTSLENIHKVIDPLFLDDLRANLDEIKELKNGKQRKEKAEEYRTNLASLTFLDPACGSGNFLTETYISLRRLENEALRVIYDEEKLLDLGGIIKVNINQFYGIEINDFAVTVAKTALWIAESQMLKETEDVVHTAIDFLPIKSYSGIVEGNALRMDWAEVVAESQSSEFGARSSEFKDEKNGGSRVVATVRDGELQTSNSKLQTSLNYIMGNPPFIGFTFMTAEQKEDIQNLFPGVKNLDYVCGWYKKASGLIRDTKTEVAFVSTNSICQGETVARFWNALPDDIINFAHTSFIWDSEATQKAHVHCVIIGFAKFSRDAKFIYDEAKKVKAKNINRYLIDGDNIVVESRNKPICNVPKMIYGNKPADGGNLIIEAEDYEAFITKDPNAKAFIKPLLGAEEYIKGKKRWCLWLDGVSPSEIRKSPLVMERIEKCKNMRLNSDAAAIRKFADTPTLFAQRTQPTDKDFIIVPCVSSETRKYIPIGFVKAGTIVTNANLIIPDASIFDFGIIISSLHMAWMRAVAGRLKSDYRYSKDIVYNNFPWPETVTETAQKLRTPSSELRTSIERSAQWILDARALYPDSSLADLYDELTMPPELRKAHQANDRAVLEAYGLPKDITEPEIVAHLMSLYQELTAKEKCK